MSLSTDLVAALGWALLDFLWQGLLVGALAAAALALLRNARPQARYAVACIALCACLALPLAGTLRAALASAPDVVATQGASVFDAALITVAPASTAVPLQWQQSLQLQMPAIVAAWSAGALLLALRLLLGCGWVSRLRAGARLPAAHWQGRCDELAVHVGLRQPVPLRVSEAIDTPATVGWWRPMVLVPAALLAGMPADLLEALLAHELAHVRRRDYLVNLLQGAVETLLFYHPVVWWLSKQARVEREQIADDLAARAIGEPRRLALALQALDRIRHTGPAPLPQAPGLLLAAEGGNLMSRIKRLLRPDRTGPDWSRALPLAALAALGLAVHVAQASAPASNINLSRNDSVREAYAMVRAGEEAMLMSGDLDDMADVRKLRQHLRGDFLWFRRGDEGYVVQDAALIARARQAWGPAQELSTRMEALSQQMQPHSARMEALSKRMEALSRGSEPQQKEMDALAKRMEPLAKQMAELADQRHEQARARVSDAEVARTDASNARVDARMQELNTQMEDLSRQMEAKSESMRRAQEPIEDLSRQMEAASRPMEALGKQMEALGKPMEAMTHRADAEVGKLIEDALRNGKAAPTRDITR